MRTGEELSETPAWMKHHRAERRHGPKGAKVAKEQRAGEVCVVVGYSTLSWSQRGRV